MTDDEMNELAEEWALETDLLDLEDDEADYAPEVEEVLMEDEELAPEQLPTLTEAPDEGTVGVFVLHWGGEDDEHRQKTVQCVNSWIDEAKDLNAQVTIIDNGSPVKIEPLKKWGKTVTVMRLDKNLFLIDAFNEAMQAYPASIYICVTNDTWRDGYPFLSGIVDVLRRDKRNGIVSPGTNDRGAGELYVPVAGAKPDHSTPHVDNTVWAWRHDLVEAIGWPTCEEHTDRACWYCNKDYAARARKAGYRVVAATGSAYVVHAHMGGQYKEAHQAGLDWLRERATLGLYGFEEAW